MLDRSAKRSTEPGAAASPDRAYELYVAGGTDATALAEDLSATLEAEGELSPQIELIDIREDPARADSANISRTPTLVARSRTGTRRVVGDVTSAEWIKWLLGEAEGDDVRPSVHPISQTVDRSGQSLADLCPDGILILSENGRVLTSNRAAREILDIPPGAGASAPFELRHRGNLPPRRLLLLGGRQVEVRWTAIGWNGSRAHLLVLRDMRQAPILGLEHPPEDTERERAHEAALDFASRAAHDLRAPLRGIIGLTGFLIEDEDDRLSPQGHEMLEQIRESAARQRALVDRLLEYTRIGTNDRKFVKVDLNKVLRWVLSDLQMELSKIGALCELGHLPTILGDESELYRLFLNLVTNAIKYRRMDTPLQVIIDAGPSLQVGISTLAAVTVRDNGRGFASEDADRIFEPFTRLVQSDSIEGSGIGLATVAKIAGRHKGHVTAQGTPGAGATFTVELPLP